MTAPAAPLDRAVGRARTAIDALDAESQTACLRDWKSETLNECAMALRSLLAALDADKRLEEAGAALREIDNQGCEHRTPCLQHVGMGACPRCIALRYFARRGEKEGNRG